MEHAEIVHRCFRCGYCKMPGDYQDFNCPSYRQFAFDTYSSGGRMWLIYAWLNKEIETSDHYAEILFSCAACGNCKEQCVYKFNVDLLDIFEEAKAELVNRGKIPPRVRDYFKAISVNGNPYKAPKEDRGKWAEETGIEPFAGQEALFYVGCVGSYDDIGQRMARSVGILLAEAGLSFGILGSQEACDGNEVKVLGEAGLFSQLAEQNIRTFKEKGVSKIFTLDPHALNAFRNEYPRLGGAFQVEHYTEVLASLIRADRFPLAGYEARVTYHDPCYLGRHNQVYEAPRQILQAIPGLELVEMDRNRADAFCCGGGGGNFFTDILGTGKDSASRVRIREALDTGAEIVSVACPICLRMLTDAVKAEGLEQRLEVADIAEIVRRARRG